MPEPAFTDVLTAAAKLQTVLADAVLVGGTAAAHHAGHRVSFDDDHVLTDLRERFDDVLDALEATDGWVTARVQRPVLVLGRLDGIDTGIRQLRRRRPLEVETITLPNGAHVRVTTLAETIRIKAWLALTRNATRDYVDLVALCDRLGESAADVLLSLDDYYADQIGPDGRRVAAQVARQLADPRPYDLDGLDLSAYRHLAPKWRDWARVRDAARAPALRMLDRIGGGDG
jgi:hypothetical protein